MPLVNPDVQGDVWATPRAANPSGVAVPSGGVADARPPATGWEACRLPEPVPACSASLNHPSVARARCATPAARPIPENGHPSEPSLGGLTPRRSPVEAMRLLRGWHRLGASPYRCATGTGGSCTATVDTSCCCRSTGCRSGNLWHPKSEAATMSPRRHLLFAYGGWPRRCFERLGSQEE